LTIDGEAVVCGPDGVAVFDALHRTKTIGIVRVSRWTAAVGTVRGFANPRQKR
jgi:hypothetical protein